MWEHNLRLDVKDTGKGISQDEADKIFERFFQAKGAAEYARQKGLAKK